jgi:hypothetical protein
MGDISKGVADTL